MPLQNRVTPFGDVVAVAERGLLMGNRGILHDEARRIVRPWQVQRWIACRTSFRGRQRQVMRPGSYTELFFLDEATAFAAGHRPCAECRSADYRLFKAAWATWSGAATDTLRAEGMDAILHEHRLVAGSTPRHYRQRTYQDEVAALPDGTMVALDGTAWLLWRDSLHQWSPAGYVARRPRPRAGLVQVVTPLPLVGVLRAGYQVGVHPSAASYVESCGEDHGGDHDEDAG